MKFNSKKDFIYSFRTEPIMVYCRCGKKTSFIGISFNRDALCRQLFINNHGYVNIKNSVRIHVTTIMEKQQITNKLHQNGVVFNVVNECRYRAYRGDEHSKLYLVYTKHPFDLLDQGDITINDLPNKHRMVWELMMRSGYMYDRKKGIFLSPQRQFFDELLSIGNDRKRQHFRHPIQ